MTISFKKPLIAAASVLAVAACADKWDVEGTRQMDVAGGMFNSALHQEYVDLASMESAEGDWDDTAYFLDKAKMAAAGQKVAPDAVMSRDTPPHAMAELTAARQDLMAALVKGARDANPKMAAKAQAGFDCWLQEQEEDFQPEDIEACKQNFMIAMNALKPQPATPEPAPEPAPIPAMPLPAPFVVYFDFDSAQLDEMAQAVLNDVSSAYADFRGIVVTVVGHTDTSGADAYNVNLSQRRAENVSRALADMGVPMSVQSLEAYGESRLKVPTDDGVRERLNRRVEISFSR
ncbi:OmpA family protein [Roseospirillum parvum]|uniref:Outer membrane protein OmpA n=1 Tax=Roseospirillum parvum TaxID=83401 RepID=A0A1G7TJW9_9PROT|nr:OmpA family protein [Roseospirillum parvum]SDG35633.1 Outer membrane protein OmpA [Roseospirillum parvum]